MEVTPLSITGALLIKPQVHRDPRGFFLESYKKSSYSEIGITADFVQDNHSHSKKFVLRGLHYQVNNTAQGKLVWVTRGSAYDVIVDLRLSSPTFGQWIGIELTSTSLEQVWIPPGCAHGFLSLEENTDFHYKCTKLYSPPNERSLRWNDPTLNIKWPLPTGYLPTLNQKDASAPGFLECEKYPPGQPL